MKYTGWVFIKISAWQSNQALKWWQKQIFPHKVILSSHKVDNSKILDFYCIFKNRGWNYEFAQKHDSTYHFKSA